MALIDESRAAFRELREVMPSTITFNGITKTGVSQTITLKRLQQLQSSQIEASAQFELEDVDFEALVEAGLKDRESEVTIQGEEEPLVYLQKDRHPNSATVYLFLGASQ